MIIDIKVTQEEIIELITEHLHQRVPHLAINEITLVATRSGEGTIAKVDADFSQNATATAAAPKPVDSSPFVAKDKEALPVITQEDVEPEPEADMTATDAEDEDSNVPKTVADIFKTHPA